MTSAAAASVAAAGPHPGMGFRQFVGLIAAIMAVNVIDPGPG